MGDLMGYIPSIGTFPPDSTLSVRGKAADSKVVGDKIDSLNSTATALASSLNSLKTDINSLIAPRFKATYLLSNWTEIADPTSIIDNKSWKFERFNYTGSSPGTPTLESYANKIPDATSTYLDSSISITMNIRDYYVARCTTYLYCTNATTLSISFTTDDEGSIYLNDTLLGTTQSCKAKSFSCSFKAGWNKLIVMYVEVQGGDGWVTSPKLYNNSNFEYMTSQLVINWQQSVALTGIDGITSVNISSCEFMQPPYAIPSTGQTRQEKINFNATLDAINHGENRISGIREVTSVIYEEPKTDIIIYYKIKPTSSNIIKVAPRG